jgi:hypothetical protein
MALPADLAAILGQLAAMRAPDRDFVLAQLGPDGEQKLLPLIAQFQQTQISEGLQTLIAICADDQTPANVTRRGSAALRRAASKAEDVPPAAATAMGKSDGGVLSRGRAWLGLGG